VFTCAIGDMIEIIISGFGEFGVWLFLVFLFCLSIVTTALSMQLCMTISSMRLWAEKRHYSSLSRVWVRAVCVWIPVRPRGAVVGPLTRHWQTRCPRSRSTSAAFNSQDWVRSCCASPVQQIRPIMQSLTVDAGGIRC